MKYKAKLQNMGRIYSAEGDTVYSALDALSPKGVAGKSILSVSCGDKSVDRVLTPFFTKQIFRSVGMMREVSLKNTSLLFDGL